MSKKVFTGDDKFLQEFIPGVKPDNDNRPHDEIKNRFSVERENRFRPTGHSEQVEQTGQTEQGVATPSTQERVPSISTVPPVPLPHPTTASPASQPTSAAQPSVAQLATTRKEQPCPSSPAADPLRRTSSKQRKASLDEYRELFLRTPKITDRQPVFVSRATRDSIDEIVRRLGERRMSVSGFLENLANHHLETYNEEVEQWKRL